jgi:hypothetical protein
MPIAEEGNAAKWNVERGEAQNLPFCMTVNEAGLDWGLAARYSNLRPLLRSFGDYSSQQCTFSG